MRGILGRRTGHEENLDSSFAHDFAPKKKTKKINEENFDDKAKPLVYYESGLGEFKPN